MGKPRSSWSRYGESDGPNRQTPYFSVFRSLADATAFVRNPWGKRQGTIGEWAGPWSDGSKEWTPYWLNKLNYRFDDDGVFWMTYEDMLSTFPYIHRTRIFDNSWTVVQQWTNLTAAWMSSFANSKKFVV